MRQRTEAIRARQVQVEQQQIDARMLLQGIEQTGNVIGLEELHSWYTRRQRRP